MESQWWSEETIEQGAEAQLRLLLGWAVNNVAYYQNRPELADLPQRMRGKQADFAALWHDLPVLTKRDLRQHGDAIRYPRPPGPHSPAGQIRSSGSTGIPVEVLTTPVTASNWAALTLRDHLVWNRDFGRRMGAIRFLGEAARGQEGVPMPDWGRPVRGLYPSAPGGAIHIGHPPDVIARWLLRLDPTYLLTYPSVAEQLLDELGDRPGKPPALQEIRFMSEPLDDALKRRLQQRWGVRCADMYSANETGHIALTCPEYGKLHVQSETVHVELLNDQDHPCRPGETGRVIVTPLHNLATPLIRYDIGDYATAGEPCPCGRASPVLAKVLGRVRNYAVTPEGRRFWPGSLGLVREIPAIVQAQYVQLEADSIELRLVVNEPLRESEHRRAIELVRTALQQPYRVTLRYVDAIERSPTGKFEEFLSRLSGQ